MTSINDLPEILTAQQIAVYLKISLRRVYELFQTVLFAASRSAISIRIG